MGKCARIGTIGILSCALTFEQRYQGRLKGTRREHCEKKEQNFN